MVPLTTVIGTILILGIVYLGCWLDRPTRPAAPSERPGERPAVTPLEAA